MTRVSPILTKNTHRNLRLSDWTLFLVALSAVFCYDNAVQRRRTVFLWRYRIWIFESVYLTCAVRPG